MTTVVADFCVALTWDMVYYRFNHNMAAVKQILLQWNEKHFIISKRKYEPNVYTDNMLIINNIYT